MPTNGTREELDEAFANAALIAAAPELLEALKATSFMVDYFLKQTDFKNAEIEANWKKAQSNAHTLLAKFEEPTTEEKQG